MCVIIAYLFIVLIDQEFEFDFGIKDFFFYKVFFHCMNVFPEKNLFVLQCFLSNDNFFCFKKLFKFNFHSCDICFLR